MKVYLRGIYSTALTKLLLDEGFDISYPSRAIKLRLGIQGLAAKPDVVIVETPDKHGVLVRGSTRCVEETVETIVRRLKAVTVKRSTVNVGAVYRGQVLDVSGKTVLIKIGDLKGFLQNSEGLKVGENVLVQTVKPVWTSGLIPLRRHIVIEGFYMSLTQNSSVRFDSSLRRSPAIRDLMNLSSLLLKGDWGVRWKSIAVKAPIEELIKEFEELKSKARSLKGRLSNMDLVVGGEYVRMLGFPCKYLLDDLRSLVTPTVRGHHIYRGVKGMGATVDLAELMLAKKADKYLVEECLDELVGFKSMRNGDLVEFEHRKLNGEVLRLTPGVFIGVDSDFLTVRRKVYGSGFYDGLEVPKEFGDYVLTRFKPGSWLIEHRYFSSRGELKGVYMNVNTPVEVVKGLVRYLDLAVDVSAKPGEKPRLLDMDELERFHEEGVLTDFLYENALKAVEEAKRRLSELH